MISLEEFIRETKGKKIALPSGKQKGQCVSLVQQYINKCLGQPIKTRGHAKDWKNTYVSEGLGTITKSPKYGDLIVYNIGTYGHIAIYINSKKLYDQNNGYHDNYYAGYGSLLKGGTYIRPKAKLIPDKKYTSGNYKLLYAKAIRREHNTGNNILKVKNCSTLTKKYLTSKNNNDDAYLKAGTEIICRNIFKDSDGRYWGSYGNCWIVLCNKDGSEQAKKC